MMQSCDIGWWLSATAVVAFYGFIGIQIVEMFIKRYVKRQIHLQEHCKDGKTWALVTGATDGIGKEFTLQLAEKGFNIVLVGRSDVKLDSVKNELNMAYKKVDVKCIRVDFVLDDVAEYRNKLMKEVNDLKISVLVNSVGMTPGTIDRFHRISEDDEDRVIKCNIISFNSLNHLVIPQMIGRQFGVIINISSLTSKIDFPGACVYSASKAYMSRASDIMASEYRQDGIFVQTVNPWFVRTNMVADYIQQNHQTSWSVSTPRILVKACLEAIGKEQSLTGHWYHSILEFLTKYTHIYPWIKTRQFLHALNKDK